MENSFVIFGSSGHARVVLENLLSHGKKNFIGWIDPNETKGKIVFDYPILGSEKDLVSLYQRQKFSGIIGIGSIPTRQKIVENIQEQIPDFKFINAIHSSAIISPSVNLGVGIAIMPGAIINSESRVGNHCIINTGAQIDHNSMIEDFVNISPSVTMGGNVIIGRNSLIGIGAILTNNISIPEKSRIKAGSIISK